MNSTLKLNIVCFLGLCIAFILSACMDEKDAGLPVLKDHRSIADQNKACKIFNDSIDWIVEPNLYAKNFKIKSHPNFDVLEVYTGRDTNYYAKGNSDSLKLFCPKYQWLKDRSQKIVALSSIYLPYFSALNLEPLVIALANGKWIHNKTFKAMIDQFQVKDLGPYQQIKIEELIRLKADIIIDFNNVGNEIPAIKKAKKLHQRILQTNTWQEEHLLPRSEWIKVIGWLTKRSELANDKFNAIVKKYNDAKVPVDKIRIMKKIIVADPYDGQWFVPGQESYMATIIEDAAGDYLIKKGESGSVALKKEEGLLLGVDSDIWINIFNFKTKKDIVRPFSELGAVKKNQLWSATKRQNENGGNDFYELGVLRPDLILKDLRSIFYPKIYQDELYFYEKLK